MGQETQLAVLGTARESFLYYYRHSHGSSYSNDVIVTSLVLVLGDDIMTSRMMS
jgi:hypothetical protein